MCQPSFHLARAHVDVGRGPMQCPGPSYARYSSRSHDSINPVAYIIVVAALLFLVNYTVRRVRRNGGLRAVMHTLFFGVQGGVQGQWRGQGQWGGQAGGGRQPRAPTVSLGDVAAAIQQRPIELHATAEELERMHPHELKERLTARGVNCSNFIEKQELVVPLREGGGSSATSCSVCCEDFCSGEPVRVLKCSHRFHVECIDRWFLSSTDYSRSPACPL
eukprot:gene13751-19655_t